MIKEFKEFAIKGNAIDLAIGVIVGAAFGKIVDSLVNDVIMPPFGLVAGKVDFSSLFINLGSGTFETIQAAKAAGSPTINYGLFINTIINFLIISFVIFLIVRQMNRFRRHSESSPNKKDCPFCKTQISVAATRCPACTSDLN